MTIVVVAPAEATKEQLQRLGEVEVLPMPNKREEAGPSTQPDKHELLKPGDQKEPKEPKKKAA